MTPYIALTISLFLVCTTGVGATFRLGIRDSFMIAHSFHQNPAFGPAGGMHGATYTCDVDFQSEALNKDTNWVIDIGKGK